MSAKEGSDSISTKNPTHVEAKGEREITVTMNGKELAKQRAPRTIATLAKTLLERGDPRALYPAEIAITIPSP